MASLKLSDSAFGSVGLTITENLDLAALSASLSSLLGQNYQIDSLDVSNVTPGGVPNLDPELGTGGLTATGLGLAGSRLTVGAFDTFFSGFGVGDPLSVSGFETLAFTPQTVAPIGEFGAEFDIFDGEIFTYPSEQFLTFDDTLREFDFSAIGTGPLDVRLGAIFAGDTVESPAFSGYTMVGNAGDTVFRGNPGFQDVAYYGSNTYLLGEGNNTFFGGSDTASVIGGSGRDVMFVEDGNNRLDGGDGNDELFGGFLDDTLLGGAGNDILFGGESLDAGTSTLDGGAGNDWLYGSSGNHELTGGADADRFVFANNYEIVTSVQGEGVLTVNTGTAVSDLETGTNRVTDFVAGEDLLAFALDDIMLDPQSGGSLLLETGQQPGDTVESLLDVSILYGEVGESFTIEDAGGAMGVGNFIFMVEQSTALLTDRQYLDQSVFNLNQETSFDGSFELVYRSADQSQGADYDIFGGLRLQPVTAAADEPAGPIGGQDKFDLTALGLTDFAVDGGTDTREIVDAEGVATTVAGTETAVEDILFTDVEFDYLLDRLLATEPSQEDTSDFFLDNSDPDNPVYRAMHVEYTNTDGEAFIAYIDADRNGGFDLDTDMAFFVRLDLTGNSVFPVLDDVTELFNPLAEGGGTGIFIFDESQYDFWLNDEFIVEPQPN